jgi:hypothetical protein
MSLELKRLGGAIVPDRKIGAINLRRERELGGNHAFGEAGREVAGMDKTPELGFGRAGNDDDLIEMGFGGGFKQKRYVNGEPGLARLLADGGGQLKPGAAYGGMKDCLKGFSLGRIGKNNGAKGRALQHPRGIEDTGAELLAYGAEYGGIRCGQLPRTRIGIKDSQCRVEWGKTFGEECLACSYPARDTQNWHAE